MSREKQIEEMAKIFCGMKNGCDGCMWDKVHCNERNLAVEIYNEGYRKQEWISVEDRLPEPHDNVLTYDKVEFLQTNYLTLDGVWAQGVLVTHWMPLPEAPKGGE